MTDSDTDSGVTFTSLNNDSDDILVVVENKEYPPVAKLVVNSTIRARFELSEGDKLRALIGEHRTEDLPELDGIALYANFDVGAPYCTACSQQLDNWNDAVENHLRDDHDSLTSVEAVSNNLFVPVLTEAGEYDE